jgi:hypothetical protein
MNADISVSVFIVNRFELLILCLFYPPSIHRVKAFRPPAM